MTDKQAEKEDDNMFGEGLGIWQMLADRDSGVFLLESVNGLVYRYNDQEKCFDRVRLEDEPEERDAKDRAEAIRQMLDKQKSKGAS